MFQLDSDIYNKAAQSRRADQQMQLSERLGMQRDTRQQQAHDQSMRAGDAKMQSAKVERAAKYLSMATPENWAAIRQQAISEGLAPSEVIPIAYDQDWINRTAQAFAPYRTQTGGATGYLVDQLRKENPELSYADALYMAQTGFRQNMESRDGQLFPMLGAPEAKGAIKYGETMGAQQAKLATEPQIAAGKRSAESAVDLQMKPQIAKATSMAQESGKSRAESESLLRSMESKMPQLEATVQRLSELGKKATYSMAGRAEDVAQREIGLDPGEDAVARAEYTAVVNNQILPLLRDTFGAQFTQKEGESLRATLGDPNLSPSEKDAVLRAFIEQKRADVEALRQKVSPSLDSPIPKPNAGPTQIQSDEDYDALPSGAEFIAPDGTRRRKP